MGAGCSHIAKGQIQVAVFLLQQQIEAVPRKDSLPGLDIVFPQLLGRCALPDLRFQEQSVKCVFCRGCRRKAAVGNGEILPELAVLLFKDGQPTACRQGKQRGGICGVAEAVNR